MKKFIITEETLQLIANLLFELPIKYQNLINSIIKYLQSLEEHPPTDEIKI